MTTSLLGRSMASAIVCTLMTAAALAQTDARPVLRIAVQQVTTNGTLTPLREQSNVGSRIFPMIYANLIELQRQGDLSLQPSLATAWKRIDERTVELRLRRGVKFHNGDEMTAEDVAFSFGPEHMFAATAPLRAGQETRTIQTDASATGAPPAGKALELPHEVPAVARRLWPSLERVQVVDKYTVRFVNAVPDVTLEGRIARSGSEIISKRAFLAAKDWASWALNPVSAGPYKVKEFRRDNVLVLAAHDAYYGGKPPVRELRYQVVPEVSGRVAGLLSGEYDFVTDIPPDQIRTIEANPKFEVVGGPVLNHRLIAFDKHHPQLANPKIRLAMAHAIDRDAIVRALWADRTSVPAGLQWEYYGPMFQKDWSVPRYDPKLAARLIQEAGYKGEPIPFRVLNNYYTNQVQTAQILVEMWRAVGLNVELQMKENWQQIFDRSAPRGLRDWSNSAPFNDPVGSIINNHGPNGQQQQMGEWSNDEFNTLSSLLESSADMARRSRVFRRMLEIAEREDPAYIVLHRNAAFYGKRRDIGWTWSPTFAMDFRADNLHLPKK
ncbi:ABC transporter substrate-binding protein [Verminephrobacter aporrectodeae]|uniref:ABC transporter substrate-binding protein n=1 Tax=Verminephrobacter aporrectodeae TaxID=1110389 RepID=UPI002242DA7B|nr:ABC transporter substrate-binding protein [Verminephrobacter aporrectodeae]MCW8175220.1 ABC transporter substrate-binding protein [Verminephrobacter aporrectodeae subsp. tuberculatae]MCW8202679.1 ABC transporter substrate-binding protein [Verminephrobacter aporrectodeae subsp. tuberculatae]